MLNPTEAAEKASELYEIRNRERKRLDTIRLYLQGRPELTYLPPDTPRELQALAKMARVPLMKLIVNATTQQMFVDGYQSADTEAADTIWREIWQSNRWDKKQIPLHKSTAAYGVAYGAILPAADDDAPPVIRPLSARKMTAAYGDDDEWPEYALEQRKDGTWWLYDDTGVYELRRLDKPVRRPGKTTIVFEQVGFTEHEQDVCPVVRYLADEDLDDPVQGDIEPNMTLQDQINLCTLHLLVAQHYGAHGRKILIGKMMESVEKQLKSSASTLLAINAHPSDFAVEELSQTQLDGFIAARESAARFAAAISQTPTHELLGTLSNLAAASLVEVRESTARKVAERKVMIGESHEQLLGQAGTLLGIPVDPAARVRWKRLIDARAVQFVELLGLLAEKLGVPEEALWQETPFSDATVAEWRAMAAEQQPASVTPVETPTLVPLTDVTAPTEDDDTTELTTS